MVIFQEPALYHHIDGREVEAKEKFIDVWAKGFSIVLKGNSLSWWFKNQSELQPANNGDGTGDYDDPTFSELEEMELDDDFGYIIDMHSHMWESASDNTLN